MGSDVIVRVKQAVESQSVADTLIKAWGNQAEADLFKVSLIDAITSNNKLQECEPKNLIAEAYKAATLKLPINASLGFAYLVPYKIKGKMVAQFQPGYKGLIQLAQRTGKYKYINADVVYKGELKKSDKLTGELDITGEAESDEVVGYFAYFELLNGFRKAIYWSHDKVFAHAKRYSKSFSYDNSPWQVNFEEMALKTLLKRIISKYGVMSIEMLNAVNSDTDVDEIDFEKTVKQEINSNTGTGDVIDAEYNVAEDEEVVAEEPVKEEPPKAEKPKVEKKETVKEEPKEVDPFA